MDDFFNRKYIKSIAEAAPTNLLVIKALSLTALVSIQKEMFAAANKSCYDLEFNLLEWFKQAKSEIYFSLGEYNYFKYALFAKIKELGFDFKEDKDCTKITISW